MAAVDDVNAALASLKDAITLALNDLASRADAGSLSGADVRNVIGQLNTEHDAVLAAVSAVDNPPAPAPAPEPAPPADGGTGSTDTSGTDASGTDTSGASTPAS